MTMVMSVHKRLGLSSLLVPEYWLEEMIKVRRMETVRRSLKRLRRLKRKLDWRMGYEAWRQESHVEVNLASGWRRISRFRIQWTSTTVKKMNFRKA